MTKKSLIFLSVLFIFLFIKDAQATLSNEVLLVVNDNSPYSISIGNYYQSVRGIPDSNICHINSLTTETITRDYYHTHIKDPIKSYLEDQGLSNSVYYIVTTKGVPLRIEAQDISNDRSSVNSELTLLNYSYNIGGFIGNPYYGQNKSFRDFRDQTGSELYLVGSLTGYETDSDCDGMPDDVKALIDRAQNPSASGIFVLDEDITKTGAYETGNNWMDEADEILTNQGANTHHDETGTFVSNQSDILGYCSWGSNDSNSPSPPYYDSFTPGSWANGALATTYVSSNARSFNTGTPYGQSLIADLIHLGASGAQGHVYEPYLGACARPQILFPRYFAGYEMLESYYMATPRLSWQEVNVGDPLMVIPEPDTFLLFSICLLALPVIFFKRRFFKIEHNKAQ